MVDDIQEMLVVVLLPFSIIAAGITLAILVVVMLVVAFWSLFAGSRE